MPVERLAAVTTIGTVLGLVPVGVIALVGVLATGETQQWNLRWADRMVAIAAVASLTWLAFAATSIMLWLRYLRARRSVESPLPPDSRD